MGSWQPYTWDVPYDDAGYAIAPLVPLIGFHAALRGQPKVVGGTLGHGCSREAEVGYLCDRSVTCT